MAAYGDDGFWSEDTCKLTDIIEDLPTLVRVCEGIYGSSDATTFSQGDLIKIDACKPMTRVTAYLTQPGSNIRYEKFGSEISLPYHYNGRVRVEPLHGEYHKYNSVKDLIEYFPRNIRVLGHIGFKDRTGKPQALHPGAILELKAVRKNESGFATSLRCTLQGQDIILPRDTSGVFQVLPDEEEQTIRTVVETYKLPQCVRFIGHGVQEIMSRDIQEAIDNLATYSGELILTGKMESSPVLFGHYKGLERDEASSRFCSRSAVVIPLDTPEIINIDVQLPSYHDPSDYELFLLKNFSQSTSTPQFLEGSLYADFSKITQVQFIPDSTPPAIPPRRKPGDVIYTRTEDIQDTPPPVPRRTYREERDDLVQLPIALKKHKHHFKKMLSDLVHKVRIEGKGPSLGLEPEEDTCEGEDTCEEEDPDTEVTYDYIEIDEEFSQTMLSKANKSPKPVLEVSPSVRSPKPEMPENDFSEMTISELEAVLTRCGMGELAKVCKRECVDGILFASFTPDILKKKPFNLSKWKIKKVSEIKNGWRPKGAFGGRPSLGSL